MMQRARYPITIAMGALVGVLIAVAPSVAAQSPQTPIAGASIPQFIQPLPTLTVSPVGGTIQTFLGNTALDIRMCEFQAKMLPPGTFAAGVQPLTWVWGYLVDLGVGTIPANGGGTRCDDLVDYYDDGLDNNSFGPLDTPIGPVLVSERGLGSTDVTWINDLGYASSTQVLAYKYATDQTLHWADPLGEDCMVTLEGGIPPFNSTCAENYLGPIPAVAHLHGGEVPAEIDGSPDSWFTSDGSIIGSRAYTFNTSLAGNQALYKYPNTQEAAPLWFHDHTLGATRLNVFAGMAGAYFIHDPDLDLPLNLHPLTEVVPIVIQDRMFDTNGQLFYQSDSAGNILWVTNPEHPYWTPEFVGDTIMVNGKVWPYLNVEPKRYRFLFLNGSNARAYEMFFTNPVTKVDGPPLWVIATDGGYLDTPQKIDPALGQKLVMQPGERYEVIVDFAGLAGNSLLLRNVARTPYPGGETAKGNTTGRVMMVNVKLPLGAPDTSYDPALSPQLRLNASQRIVRLADPATGAPAAGVTVNVSRQLTLNEVMMPPVTTIDPVTGLTTAFPGGPLEVLVNNTKWSGTHMGVIRGDFTPATANGVTTYISEIPVEGDTEVWEIVNLTADAHPIHLHLVQFQLMNRQNFDLKKYTKVYDGSFPGGAFMPAYGPPLNYNIINASGAIGGNPDVTPYLKGPVRLPLPWEAGWKDTVIMYPGQVTRIAVRYAPTDIPVVGTAAADLHYPFDPSGYDAGSDMPYFYNYVWHCHIIDHEDNEMMRPAAVDLNLAAPLPAARDLVKGTDY